MSVSALETSTASIATAAFTLTFLGESDINGIAQKFGDKFGADFATAVQTYVGTCIGLPVGGIVTPGATTTLEADICAAGEAAYIETFQGEDDINNIAKKFGDELAPMAAAIGTYMGTVMTILGVFPTYISVGGPVIAVASTSCVPIFLAAGQAAFTESFQGEADTYGIALLFGTTFSTIGNLIYTYVATCTSLPGGGALVAS